MNSIAIYTDLDGTLLDHRDYSHTAADGWLRRLEGRGIPVIFTTSKTRAELLLLRRELHNRHPFIAENGAAVFIPEDDALDPPPDASLRDGYWVKTFVPGRSHWLALLERARERFDGLFRTFHDMSPDELAACTGLSPAQAALAAAREYGEPVQWLGGASRRDAFVTELERLGARVLRGGRFLHVSGACDKGRAMLWLNRRLAAASPPTTIALGDSQNDVAMLEAADHAVLVRSPAHPFPEIRSGVNLVRTSASGPDGWVEGVAKVIEDIEASRG